MPGTIHHYNSLSTFFEEIRAEHKLLQSNKNSTNLSNIDNEIELAFECPVDAPFPTLSEEDIAHIIQIGKDLPWGDRSRRDKRDAFEWVTQQYGMFIPGLTQAHVLQADPGLWAELQGKLTDARHGRAVLPDDFNVPSERDARLLKETDEEKRDAIVAKREYDRVRKAAQRLRGRANVPKP